MMECMEDTKTEIITPLNILVSVLSFVGGWINITGYNLFMHTRPSSMTGRAAEIAESFARGEFKICAYLSFVVILFVIGVIISSLITQRFGFNGGIIFVISILTFDIFLVSIDHHLGFLPVTLSMAMGAQNGATSMTAINRTTHMSGATTEIGTNIAFKNWNKAIYWGLRWLLFPLGGFTSYKFIEWLNVNKLNQSITLIIPIIILIFTILIQKKHYDIEVLDIYKPRK